MDMAKVMEYMEEMDSNWLDLMQLCLHEADGERALAAYILLGLSVNQSSGDIPKDATDRLLVGSDKPCRMLLLTFDHLNRYHPVFIFSFRSRYGNVSKT